MHFLPVWVIKLPRDPRVKFVLYAEMWYGALIYILYILRNTSHVASPTYGPTYVVEVKKGYI